MIGKGKRSQAVIDAIVRNGSVYFAAIGGAGALLSQRIKKSEVVAYGDLGTEAIRMISFMHAKILSFGMSFFVFTETIAISPFFT